MWENVQSFASNDLAMWGTWALTITLMLIGLAGTVLPLLPGPLIIFVAGLVHTFLRPQSAMSWWGLTILGLLVALSYVVDFVSGAVGSKWFGGSKWGVWGVILGGIVGLFFAPFGIILGPLIGGFAFEIFFAKKRIGPATKSTVGVAVGTTVGLAARLTISMIMVIWFFADAFWI